MRIALRILKWVAIILIVVFIGIQFVRPARTNPPTDESQTIYARMQVPTEVKTIIDRSCRDCHSHKTEWPWYTQVTPVSWWIVDHVDTGRKDLNLSEWGKLPQDRQDRKLRQICDDIDDARIYGGIHFRFDQEAGVRLGREVATAVYKDNLQPVH